jgi:uncharacterized iron-regulated membrane protein
MSVDDQQTLDEPSAGPPTAPVSRPTRRKRRRKPIKRATIVVHRWSSLVIGLVLLLITTTGALVIYSPEWTRWTNSDAFSVTHSSNPISIPQAIDVVNTAHPDFHAGSVNVYKGLYEVFATDGDAIPGFYGVDPGTGHITGRVYPDRGVMAFFNQIHECFFTCDDYPGYIGFLNKSVPTLGMSWLTDVTWSGLILGLIGLFLIFLAVSGIWLWWPGIKKWAHGFRVRWNKGRYARDYDLHQVIGMAAVPFLLMWGLTGASFEFNWVNTAWYAVTGGHTVADDDFASAEVKDPNTPDISLDSAIAAARSKAGDAKLVYVSLPSADDATSTYSFYFSKDFDQYREGAYPGQYGVDVDRHDAGNLHVDDLGSAPTLSNKLLDSWGSAMFHYGQSVNAWWRAIWFAFGLTPLLLAATGVSTWLAKRSVRKRRKQVDRTPTPVGSSQ